MSEEKKTSTKGKKKTKGKGKKKSKSSKSSKISKASKEPPNWLEKPGRVNQIYVSLWVVCGLLVVADLFYKKHAHFPVEKWFGFYGFYGFIACVVLVLAATQMRKLLMREEDYYDQ